MIRNILFFLLVFSSSLRALAAETSPPHIPDTSHVRISLITCGPGYNEVYEVFGHTGIRVIDSVRHTDMVYNYGTFEYGPDFEMQFARGKLLYSLSVYPFRDFLQEYIETKRSVSEQVLLLDYFQKKYFISFLDNNARPENKYYKYDFFYDNCATRIRDIFPEVARRKFAFAHTLPSPRARITFRDIINQYFYTKLWERFGVNILLGSRIDRVMTDKDIMFLPDYLSTGVGGATMDGQPIAAGKQVILPGDPPRPAGINYPFLLTCLIAVLTIAGLSVKSLSRLGKVMSSLLLLLTGLLGILILIMWFATDHGGCHDNFNLLWLLPTNVIIAFASPKGKSKYAIVGIVLIFVTVLLHITGVQQLLLLEFSPILLSLLYIYASIYRKSKLTPVTRNVSGNTIISQN